MTVTTDAVLLRLRAVRASSAPGGLAAPVLTEAEIVAGAITPALAVLSDNRPRVRVAEYAGDGLAFDFALPGWDPTQSAVLDVAWPAGQARAFLAPERWEVWQSTIDAYAVRFLVAADVPATGDVVRVRYTAPYAVEADVRAGDREAFITLAASYAAAMIGRDAAQQRGRNLAADGTASIELARWWAEEADRLRSEYRRMVGIEGQGGGASRSEVSSSGGGGTAVAIADWGTVAADGPYYALTRYFRGRA